MPQRKVLSYWTESRSPNPPSLARPFAPACAFSSRRQLSHLATHLLDHAHSSSESSLNCLSIQLIIRLLVPPSHHFLATCCSSLQQPGPYGIQPERVLAMSETDNGIASLTYMLHPNPPALPPVLVASSAYWFLEWLN